VIGGNRTKRKVAGWGREGKGGVEEDGSRGGGVWSQSRRGTRERRRERCGKKGRRGEGGEKRKYVCGKGRERSHELLSIQARVFACSLARVTSATSIPPAPIGT